MLIIHARQRLTAYDYPIDGVGGKTRGGDVASMLYHRWRLHATKILTEEIPLLTKERCKRIKADNVHVFKRRRNFGIAHPQFSIPTYLLQRA